MLSFCIRLGPGPSHPTSFNSSLAHSSFCTPLAHAEVPLRQRVKCVTGDGTGQLELDVLVVPMLPVFVVGGVMQERLPEFWPAVAGFIIASTLL